MNFKIYQDQKGNVLWFILLAIVLLAAITLLLSRSGSNVEQEGNRERTEIQVSQIMRFASALEAGVQKLMMGGCSEQQLSFESTESGVIYANPNSPLDESCHLFEPEGAGLKWRTFTTGTIPGGAFTSQGISRDAGIANLGTPELDLLFIVKISENQCSVINDKFGIDDSNPNDIRANSFDVLDSPANGTFPPGATLLGVTNDAENVDGRTSGCFLMDSGDFIFYHTLLSR